jgi:signal transduction histidine kinase
MILKEYMKNRFKYITLFLIVISTINIYLFSINAFENKFSELIYLDFIVLLIIGAFFIVDYIQCKNKYKELYKCLDENDYIDEYLIKGQSSEEKLMKSIIENLKIKNDNEVKSYRQSLKELDEYIAKWVHEIKIPISALNIITDRLSNIEDSIDVKNQIAKMNFLVNSILYSSRGSSIFEDIFINKVNLEKLVKTSVKNNSFLLIKNNIEVELNNLDYIVYSDIKCMAYILDQIINNAIKYSKEVGKIEFLAKEIENGIVLSIRDYGIGINEEDISRIFDKGFTGSNGRNKLYKSTGMGMYFTKKMIDKLGHKIDVCSEKGVYTNYNIYFYNISDYLNLNN